MEDARALSLDGVHWEIQVLCEQPEHTWRSSNQGDPVMRYLRFGTWSHATGLRRVPLSPILDLDLLLGASAALTERLPNCLDELPFVPADRHELWLVDSEGLAFALRASSVTASEAAATRPEPWVASRPSDHSFQSSRLSKRGIPAHQDQDPRHHATLLERDTAGRPPGVAWLERDPVRADGSPQSDHETAGNRPGQSHAEGLPPLLLREEWTQPADRDLVRDYLDWCAPFLLTLPDLDDAQRDRLEHAARARALEVDALHRLYPKVLNPGLLDAIRGRGPDPPIPGRRTLLRNRKGKTMTFLSDLQIVAEALDRQVADARAGAVPVLAQRPMSTIIEDLQLDRFARRGGLKGDALRRFMHAYLPTIINLHQPGYMGHQVAVPHPSAALGALIDGLTNNPMPIYEMGPGATAIESFILDWMLKKVGWTPPEPGRRTGEGVGGGVLTHGGSLANLTALIAARSAVRPDTWRQGAAGDLALMAPGNNHYSIERAAGILGLGTDNIYRVPMDARGAMDPRSLPATLARIRRDGKTPMALVANACSTAVGIYDRLRPIGEFCREQGIWLHVDGAHGASALLSPVYRHLLDGVELASSLTWDAHKMMRTPSVCAAMLVRDHRTIDIAFDQDANYLIHDRDQPGFDFLHRTVECTKSGMGLRFFMTLGALGEEGLARYVERQYALAARAHEYLEGLDWIETPVAPQANILCFRVAGSDARQLELRKRILVEGDFYITSTLFADQRYLRLVFMHPDTTLDDVKRLMDRVRHFNGECDVA